jgi:hypothetical protein
MTKSSAAKGRFRLSLRMRFGVAQRNAAVHSADHAALDSPKDYTYNSDS